MKILLIKPRWFVKGGVYRYLEKIKFAPLHIAVIAALSEGHDVKLVDNDWEDIPYQERFDLVGITATTFTSERVYQIARHFRRQGSKVVLGGVHPTLLPDECLKHADAVVVGEAEYVWSELLKDMAAGRLKKVYHNPTPVDMDHVPFPRRDLLNEDYRVATIQATRGCPNTCNFCYLASMPWAAYRKRDINLVYEELKQLKQKVFFFVDDNLFGDEEYVIKLCERIAPLKKAWSVQAPMNIANNERMLSKMKQAGCFNVQIGFQTVNPSSLEWASIRQNKVEKYRSVVNKLHRHNILVVGFFIFGFDYDDKRIFDRTLGIIKQLDLDDAHLYILTPYPGTKLYDKFKQEGRLLAGKDRTHYGWVSAVYQPKLMSPGELERGVQQMYQKLYSHMRARAPFKMFRRLGLFLRNPRLLKLVIEGTLQDSDISKQVVPDDLS
ncbi:MAG: radical SAM protein [Candidatus Brocadiia bacterium]